MLCSNCNTQEKEVLSSWDISSQIQMMNPVCPKLLALAQRSKYLWSYK